VLVDPPSPVKRQRAAETQPIQDFSRANGSFRRPLKYTKWVLTSMRRVWPPTLPHLQLCLGFPNPR
jgi:hypothetical protein